MDGTNIYVMRIVETNYHKIGSAKNVDARRWQLQTGAPGRLDVLAAGYVETVTEGYKIETKIHRILKRLGFHVYGEWFSSDAGLASVILSNPTGPWLGHWLGGLHEGASVIVPKLNIQCDFFLRRGTGTRCVGVSKCACPLCHRHICSWHQGPRSRLGPDIFYCATCPVPGELRERRREVRRQEMYESPPKAIEKPI